LRIVRAHPHPAVKFSSSSAEDDGEVARSGADAGGITMSTLKKSYGRWPRWPWWANWKHVREERQDLADLGTAFALDLSLAGRSRLRPGATDPAAQASAREGVVPLL
jgi:hypothetical protein